MDIAPDISASISHADSLLCVDQTLVKMEPRNEYDETSIIVIKQEINSDDENETNDHGEYYSYIDASTLEEVDGSLISGIQNHSEESGELSLQNSDTSYVMICENIEDNSGVLHFRLLNEKPLINSFKTVTSSIENNRQNKLKMKARMKNTMLSINIQPDLERPFRCCECDARFEVRSHLVMHELGHERYKKYKQASNLPSAIDSIKQPILHLCKYCDASFEHKNHLLMHEVYHEDDENSMCSCRKSLRTTSDLCKCFVRECQSCHRKFFAAVKLGNWNACIKCFFLNNSNLKQAEGSEESDHQNYSMYRNVKTIDIKQKSIETVEITNVKKLCYSCGKMCSNVINAGASWICYDCWNTKMKHKRIKESYPRLRKRLKYGKTDCVYCSQLYPYKSLRKDHQCLHKSVYLKDENGSSQTLIENSSYIEVKLPDEKIGEHFLLSSMDNSLESPILVENSSSSLKDVSSIVGAENSVHSNYTPRTLIIPSKQFKPLRNSSLKGVPANQLKQPQSCSWSTFSDDDKDDDDCGGNSDCEYHVNEEMTAAEVAQDDNSTRTVILCDKTGELIHLNSETAQSQENENHIVAQL